MIYLFLAPGFEGGRSAVSAGHSAGAPDWRLRPSASAGGAFGAHGVVVEADLSEQDYDPAAPAEAVILPGGMPGTRHPDESPVVDEALKHAAACGAWLCAICAAPSVLGRRGYLRGLRATISPALRTHWTARGRSAARSSGTGRSSLPPGRALPWSSDLRLSAYCVRFEQAGRIRAGIRAPRRPWEPSGKAPCRDISPEGV